MTSGVERIVTLQKKRGTLNVERLTALRDARTAWHELRPTNRVSPAIETP